MDNLYIEAKDAYASKDMATLANVNKRIRALNQNGQNAYIGYPSLDNDNFNKVITQKKEFRRNKYTKETRNIEVVANEKCSTSRFLLTPNQKFVKNYMSKNTPYNSILLYHSVGSGKTYSAVSIAEQYVHDFKKPALVIAPTKLKHNFMKAIFDIEKVGFINGVYDGTSNQPTGTTYLNLISDRPKLNKASLDERIKKIIKQKYQFRGYVEFANEYERIKQYVEGMEKNESKKLKRFEQKLRDVYSDRVIIIDEVHNIRLSSESAQKKVPSKLEHILRVCTGIKLVLLSATPMFNSAYEIVYLLNYMLLNDKQPTLTRDLVFDKHGHLTQEGKQRLLDASRGRISYIQGENPYTFPLRLYPSINQDPNILSINDLPRKDIFNLKMPSSSKIDKIEIIKSEMSPYQNEAVYSIFEERMDKAEFDIIEAKLDEEDPEHGDNDIEKEPTDMQMGIQISNIVYPSVKNSGDIKDYYGKRGFDQCFKKNDASKSLKLSYDENVRTKFGEFLSQEHLGTYSSKLKTIVDYIKKSDGIVYVYSTYIYAGVLPLALALEHIGFNKYGGNNILEGIKKKEKVKFNGKTPSYIILSATESLSSKFDEEIKMSKSEANKNGEIIKVIIGTNVATEGIDFKRIREIHIVEPWYHLNKLEQVFGRGIRNCSHIDLPIEKRNVTLYKHANVRSGSDRETIDLRIYRIANEKQEKIDEVAKVLKRNAVDCFMNKNALTYDVNILSDASIETSQGTRVSNYRLDPSFTSIHSCYPNDFASEDINSSSFNSSFIGDDIEYYISFITPLYKLGVYYTYSQIRDILETHIDNFDLEVYNYALNEMLRSKRIVRDHQNRDGYLIYASNKYVFQRTDIDDNRMILDERKDGKQKNQRKINIKGIGETRQNDKEHDVNDLYKKLSNAINILLKLVNDDTYEAYIYDYVVDRLSQTELFQLVEDVLKHDKANIPWSIPTLKSTNLKQSVYDTNSIFKANNKIYYVDLYTNRDEKYFNAYYLFKDTKLVQVPLSEVDDVVKLEMKLQSELKSKYQQLSGFVSVEKDDRFKLVMENAKGSVGSICTQNSALKVDKLREMINKIDNSLTSVEKAKRGALCDLYELTLRKVKPNTFARAYHYFLLKNNIRPVVDIPPPKDKATKKKVAKKQ